MAASGPGLSRAAGCIARVAAAAGVCYAVLYGSRAAGYAGPHSDYDVAVRVGRRLGLPERGLLASELEACLGGRVDLAFLDDWNPILAWEALGRGRLVYVRGSDCVKMYYYDLARAIDEVADLEPVIRLFWGETLDALAGARRRGPRGLGGALRG